MAPTTPKAHHLLNNGAAVNQRDGQGWTPLHRAAHLAHLDGYLEIYEYLLVGSPLNHRCSPIAQVPLLKQPQLSTVWEAAGRVVTIMPGEFPLQVHSQLTTHTGNE